MTDANRRIRSRTEAEEVSGETVARNDPETPAEGERGMQGRPAGLWSDAWRDLRTNPVFVISALLIVLVLLMAFVPSLFTSFYPGEADPNACSLSNSANVPGQGRPSATHWFGYDIQGCDYYAQVVHGARVSITVGLIVVGGAFLIAVLLGSVAGYYGGLLDTLIARMTDVWFAIPTLLGGIVVLSVMGDRGVLQVAFVLTILGWPSMLRLMRSSVLSVKEMDYVAASRALGASDTRLIVRHILPNALAPVIVYATIFVGVVISAEAALSFLGVGLQLPAISWGLMINTASNRILTAPHLLFFPGLFLSITVFSFILMGDALRDALDPKLR